MNENLVSAYKMATVCLDDSVCVKNIQDINFYPSSTVLAVLPNLYEETTNEKG